MSIRIALKIQLNSGGSIDAIEGDASRKLFSKQFLKGGGRHSRDIQ
jgi:hypothetical protein